MIYFLLCDNKFKSSILLSYNILRNEITFVTPRVAKMGLFSKKTVYTPPPPKKV